MLNPQNETPLLKSESGAHTSSTASTSSTSRLAPLPDPLLDLPPELQVFKYNYTCPPAPKLQRPAQTQRTPLTDKEKSEQEFDWIINLNSNAAPIARDANAMNRNQRRVNLDIEDEDDVIQRPPFIFNPRNRL